MSVASHGNFSLKIPNLKNPNLSNIPASINSLKNQVTAGDSTTKKDTNNTKIDSGLDQLNDIKNSVTELKKEIDEVLNSKQ